MYILICDDNREDRNCCREQIVKLWGDPQDPLAIEEFASGEELLFRMEDIYSQVDLIYLDIVMSGADGLAVARKLRDLGYLGEIVFFSGTGDYAVRGYDYDALNYIVKGKTTESRFYDILRRAQKRRADRERDVILLNCAGEKRCIALDAIRYFEIIKRVICITVAVKRSSSIRRWGSWKRNLPARILSERTNRSWSIGAIWRRSRRVLSRCRTEHSFLPDSAMRRRFAMRRSSGRQKARFVTKNLRFMTWAAAAGQDRAIITAERGV